MLSMSTSTVTSSRWIVIEEVSPAYVIVFSYIMWHYRRNSVTGDEGWHSVNEQGIRRLPFAHCVHRT